MTVHVDLVGDAMVLTIDRPAVKNAIDRRVARLLAEAVRGAAESPNVRGVVLTGAGSDIFVSGGDLREIDEAVRRGEGPMDVLDMGQEMAALEDCDIPVIAAVQGTALGGGTELLLLCDMVVMERHASMSFKHAKMGLSPAWGGVTRLIERVGAQNAARLLLTAERVPAEEACRMGLVMEVVDQGCARERAIALVHRLADNPRASVAAIKKALREVKKARRGEALERERDIFAELWGGDAHEAALSAYRARSS